LRFVGAARADRSALSSKGAMLGDLIANRVEPAEGETSLSSVS